MNHVLPLKGLRDARIHMLEALATAIDTRPMTNPNTALHRDACMQEAAY